MDFESHTFGVKIVDDTITINLIDSLADLVKYQFVLSDKITYSYNGNTSYGINIQQLTTKEHIEFFGWKLIHLSFEGNWRGQVGVWELEDLYGKRKKISASAQARYSENSEAMIKESIEKAKEFAKNNYSVEYNEIIENESLLSIVHATTQFGVPSKEINGKDMLLLPKGNKISLKGFTKLISSTKQYLEDYQKILSTLTKNKDQRNALFINTLNESFINQIKKYYPYEIQDLSDKK